MNTLTRLARVVLPTRGSPSILFSEVGQQHSNSATRVAIKVQSVSTFASVANGKWPFLKGPKTSLGFLRSCIFLCLPGRCKGTGNGMIVYSRIAPSDSPAVAKHLLENFYEHEPIGLALGLTVSEVKHWFPTFLAEVVNYFEPVSFMAKDSATNEIVGVIISIVMDLENQPLPPSMKSYISKGKEPVKWQIVTFLEDLEKGVEPVATMGMDPSKSNKILTCLFLSVSTNYGGRGLAKTLLRESEQQARKLDGVTLAMSDATSHFSFTAFKKLGYDCIKDVQYLMYKDHDGVPIFEGRERMLGIHTHARVMLRKL